MIPSIIHQTWKTSEIPERFQEFVSSWKTLHPDYTFMFWTDEDNLSLIQREYPDLLDIYESIPTPVMKCDFARYVILHHHGGFYVDLDVMCYKPLSDLPIEDSHELVLTEEHPTHGIEYNMKQIVTNWFMGGAKNSG